MLIVTIILSLVAVVEVVAFFYVVRQYKKVDKLVALMARRSAADALGKGRGTSSF